MGFGVDRVPSNYKVLGLHVLTSSTSTATTHTNYQAEGLTKSIIYGGNRILRVSAQFHCYASGGAQRMRFKFIRGSTDLIVFATASISSTDIASVFLSHVFLGPTSGATETFTVQFSAADANTLVQSHGDAASPRYLLVEDLGPQ